MPITIPTLDDRGYADLLAEAVARIPVHTPEWTNFNRSDPGITLIEMFAFLTETTIFRANLIPERNRLAFLSLLGIPLQPARSAMGIVTVSNERGPLETLTLSGDLEVRAAQVPYRTDTGLDVLPVEGRVYVKRRVVLTADLTQRYQQLYASMLVDGVPGQPPADLTPYQSTLVDGSDPAGVDLLTNTVDRCLWVALLARVPEELADARAQLGSRVLNLAVVPVVTDVAVTLAPSGVGSETGPSAHLDYSLPQAAALPRDQALRVATYRPIAAREDVDVLRHPGVVQLPLPIADALGTWTDLQPLENGAGAFPPALDDPALDERLVTWVRIQAQGSGDARVLWAGVNAVGVTQRARVLGEILPDGTGAPDQAAQLGRSPVLPGTVTLTVGRPGSEKIWTEVSDLAQGGPEVRISDPALPPGTTQPQRGKDTVFALDAEAGRLTFGDGLRGRRPAPGDRMRVDYDYAVGQAGNVGAGVITGGPTLPPGFTVKNPVRTWGGADAETAEAGTRQVSRYLQHRDRLVSADDFNTIALRAPGTDLARVDVLAAYDPQLAPNTPGDAPGAVTVMVVPRRDQTTPDSPSPDRFTLDAVCAYLEPRRLVTTELFLRGPEYVPVWISVGIDVLGGLSIAEVRARVTAELRRVLSPLPLDAQPEQLPGSALPTYPHAATGWPLRTAVSVAELSAYVTRVDGVHLVNEILLAPGSEDARDRVDLTGLQLPRIAGVSVTSGDAAALNAVRGLTPTTGPRGTLPVPVFAEGC